jgi:acyl carrier protein
MDLQNFAEKFADHFDETDATEFNASTKFKSLVDWSSVVALSIIAMIDDEYGVTIKGEDILKSQTIEDLFNFIKEYKS